MATRRQPRGSEKLQAALGDRGARAFLSAVSGWKVIDWHELGQPAVELVTGAIAGRPTKIGATIDKLLALERVRGIEILINGQPKPDLAEIRFQIRTRG
jgi:hypothetical protein